MIIFGGQRILSYGRKDFSRGKPICITVGEPLPIPQGVRRRRGHRASCTPGWPRCSTRPSTATPTSPRAPGGSPSVGGGSAPSLEEALEIEERVRAEKAAKRAAEGKKPA